MVMKETVVWHGGRAESVYDSICIPGIVATDRGTLLAYAEARDLKNIFPGLWIDWAPIDLILKRSTDGGETWSETKVLCNGVNASEPGGLRTVNNPVMIVDGAIIHLLYSVWYGLEKSRNKRGADGGVFYTKSEDDGLTWCDARDISAVCHKKEFPRNLFAVGPGHGIVLSGKSKNPGMLLAPVWMTPVTTVDDMDHKLPVVTTIYSLNHGETWQVGDIIYSTEKIINPNETAAVELSDGSVMLNMRNESPEKRRSVSVSPTGFNGWTTPQFDENLPDPTCFGSIVRYSKNTILFVNCANDEKNPSSWMAGRINLTVRISRDDGKTWEASRILVSGKAGYSDIAVAPDGMIYVLYDIDHGDTSMNLLKFNLDWIYG
ncbi:MAG: glycoside hydrolase [Oscillospiraceae bacterium]|nr:glycoside hydrolase [Oscillospiraceae bacterium]